MRAGAGKVDITPDTNAIPPAYYTVLDHIYARAIVFDNGHTRAALINGDLVNLTEDMVEEVSKQAAEILDTPPENILISATHDHSAIFGGGPNTNAPLPPNTVAEIHKIKAGMVEAVRQAKASLKPARIGFGTGQLYLNANRDAIDPQTRLWGQGTNLDYPSDKTLSVIKIESLSGELIAVYMNYAMHANTLNISGEISGDFPGVAERYIEHRYHDKAVAMWSSGAAGDQNPLYTNATEKISEVKINAIVKATHLDQTSALFKAMQDGDETANKTLPDPLIMEEGHQLIQAEGFLTAEETIRVMEGITRMSSDVEIIGAQKVLSCPARRQLNHVFQGSAGQYEDSPDPARIRIGALLIGDIALGHSSAEAYTLIGEEVKKNSKYSRTLFVTLTNNINGGFEYMPSDDAYGRYTFEVVLTALKPGCAETGIVNGITDMLDSFKK